MTSTTTLALQSELLRARGVRHGFSTRLGGVSEGPFATLNLAASPGDDREKVAENFARFSRALELDPSRLFQTSQVHGAAVRVVSRDQDRLALLNEEADALISRDPRCAVGVRVADCVPVLLHDARTGHVAGIHAGWRGVVAGVVRAGLEALAADGSSVATVVAAIGPSIGVCCFEVGDDVARSIVEAASGDDAIVRRSSPKPHVDLRRAVRLQLRALGLDDAHIEDVAGCTHCDAERFFSFRRDGARSGRHLAAIAPTTSSA